MKLFLDDIRNPGDCIKYMHAAIGQMVQLYGEDWAIVRNYSDFCDAIMSAAPEITHVSFDHDLADEHYSPIMMVADEDYDALYETFKERTGLDCARFMKTFYEKMDLPLPEIFVHSMNPVGRKNIINLFK